MLPNRDLAAKNFMVENGKITGIIDWEYSTSFPEYMEYGLVAVSQNKVEKWWLPHLKGVLSHVVSNDLGSLLRA